MDNSDTTPMLKCNTEKDKSKLHHRTAGTYMYGVTDIFVRYHTLSKIFNTLWLSLLQSLVLS